MPSEVIIPRATVGAKEDSLARIPGRNAAKDPQRIAFSRKTHGGWADVSAEQFSNEVDRLAIGLIKAGVQVGDRIGLMSRTRYEWTLADFAIWRVGAVVVPIYETSSGEQLEWIVRDSAATALLVETAAHRELADATNHETGTLQHIWTIDTGELDALMAPTTLGAASVAELEARTDSLTRESLATIVYTSGTTGRPKGCELTHDNFLAVAENAIAALGDLVQRPGSSTLLFLPLAHVFARFVEVLCVVGEARMGHSADIATILDDFAEFQPTFILAVPRVFEKIFNKATEQAVADGKGKIFAKSVAIAEAYSRALQGGQVPLGVKVQHAIFDKLVYRKLRARMGGKVEYAVSGGAPLGERLGHFFRGAGITILEGYGLTETTAPACVNLPDKVKIGTVGPPLPGIGIRIAEDSEVLVKGINIFAGYLNNPKATAEAMSDGWFHTGDLGSLDSDGYLRITGRKKEIIVTAGGKNVAPAVLEDRLRTNPLISQCLVVGDSKPFIAALITLDDEMLPGWAANHGLPADLTIDQARTNPVVLAEIQKAVDTANLAVSKAESIRKFAVLSTDFTEENGALTPTLKLRRAVVLQQFQGEVDTLYS